MATSVIDYVFRDLAISYLKRNDLGQVKPEDLVATATKSEADLANPKTREKQSSSLRPSASVPVSPVPISPQASSASQTSGKPFKQSGNPAGNLAGSPEGTLRSQTSGLINMRYDGAAGSVTKAPANAAQVYTQEQPQVIVLET